VQRGALRKEGEVTDWEEAGEKVRAFEYIGEWLNGKRRGEKADKGSLEESMGGSIDYKVSILQSKGSRTYSDSGQNGMEGERQESGRRMQWPIQVGKRGVKTGKGGTRK